MDWIQLSHLSRQFVIFSSLAIRLFENGCVEGTLKIVKRLSSLFSREDFTLPQYRLDGFQIDSLNFYVKMIIFLEENPETSDPDRLSQLLAFFRRLKTREQCLLVRKYVFEMNEEKILTGSLRHEICRQFCEIICSTGLRDIQHLCRSCLSQILNCDLLEVFLHVNYYFKCELQRNLIYRHLDFRNDFYWRWNLVRSLIYSFAELRDDQLLISLLEIIFTKSSEDIQAEANWLWIMMSGDNRKSDCLLKSTVVSRISSSPSVKNIFYNLFDSKMDLVKEKMDGNEAVECLPFVSLMRKYGPFKDPVREASYDALISLMPMVELAKLFVAGYPNIPNEMYLRDVETLFSLKVLPIGTLKRILYNFIEDEKFVHVRTLILVIAQCHEGSELGSDRDWDCLGVNLCTIDLIFTSAGYLHDYDYKRSEEMRNVYIAAVDSIIQGFSLLLDRLEPDGLEEPVISREFERIAGNLCRIFPVYNIASELWPYFSRLEVGKIVEQFAGLLIKMPFKLHSLLILSVFKSSFCNYSWRKCDPLFTDLCRQFVTHRFYEKFSSMFDSQILFECFLTFDDHVSLSIICRKLCSEMDNFFVKRMITSSHLQKLASHSAQRRAAFCSLLDHQIENLNRSQCSEQDLSEELSQLQIIRQSFGEK